MRAADVMRRTPRRLRPADSVARAALVLAQQGVGTLPVTRGSVLAGLLSEADLAAAWPSVATTLSVGEIAGRLDETSVESVLDARVVAVGPRTPLADALRLMRAHRLTALPVVRGDELVGLLVEEDLLNLLAWRLEDDAPRPEP